MTVEASLRLIWEPPTNYISLSQKLLFHLQGHAESWMRHTRISSHDCILLCARMFLSLNFVLFFFFIKQGLNDWIFPVFIFHKRETIFLVASVLSSYHLRRTRYYSSRCIHCVFQFPVKVGSLECFKSSGIFHKPTGIKRYLHSLPPESRTTQ